MRYDGLGNARDPGDLSHRPQSGRRAETALERFIVPGVQRFPGFVSGHWTVDRDAAESLVLLTYETRAAAETMSENIIGNAESQRAAGLELVGVRLLEIAATATST